jgi:ribosome recycling factor
MLEEIYKDVKDRMGKSIKAYKEKLAKIRTGRANPSLIEDLKVEYYGTEVPLMQIATITAPEPRQLLIQPWDKSAIPSIEKAIKKSEFGFNPSVDKDVIRINIPELTDERRKEYIKLARQRAEEARIAIRNIRRDGNETIKELLKEKEITEDEERRALQKIQEITDEYIKKVDELLEKKEKEIEEV